MHRVALAVLPLLALLGSSPAAVAAEAAAPWPVSAQGRPLPRPAWVLVIPARRRADGSLSIWDRSDEWNKAWRVPKSVRGISLVSLLGDSEDRRAVTAEAIDGMMVDSLSVVMRKYGAPALALAVTDGTSVALAGYVPGYAASWIPADATPDLPETRARALGMLAGLFGAQGAQAVAARAQTEAEGAEITAVRDRDDGGFDYRVSVPGGPAASRLDGIAGLSLVEVVPGAEGRSQATLSGDATQAELSRALRDRGFAVR